MSVNLILANSWSEYDNYKACTGQRPDIFLPQDAWEVEFLVMRIVSHFPQYTQMVVRLSINSVKRSLYGGCKRSLFVQLVLKNQQHEPLPDVSKGSS